MSPDTTHRQLVLRFSLVLIPLLAVIVLVLSKEQGVPDLSDYPWLYLRDQESLGPNEHLVELIAVGDVMLGRGVADEVRPFHDVRPWLEQADLVLGNLESPIAGESTIELSSGRDSRNLFLLQAPASAVLRLRRAGFDLLGLANNHALDGGPQTLAETASLLRAAGMSPLGVGSDAEVALQPLVRELKGVRMAVLGVNAVSDPRESPFGGWARADWDRDRVTAAVVAAAREADVVIVSVHWGYEYQRHADPAQHDAARALLESGAHLVIGHHPHVVQGFEVHKGGCVAYSLGNFVFDQGQGQTGQGLALRAFFDEEGLRAVQALPVWAGPRPRLMAVEESRLLLARIEPPPENLAFVCDQQTCGPVEGSLGSGHAGTGLFWGGEIDLTGDGVPEHVRRIQERAMIYRNGVEVWRSPQDWRVVDLALGDPNDDGRGELMLALWKPGLDGLEPPSAWNAEIARSRPFVVGYRGGAYRTLWGGSAVSHPIHEIELGDVDGDSIEELIVLEEWLKDPRERAISVWRWHGWGFTQVWRSPPGRYRDLVLDRDRKIYVTAD